MDDFSRPDPDKLLKQVQQDEDKTRPGRFKIFLGAAPGVGKTWSMLEEAKSKSQEGVDVVIGVVESHGRKEIDARLGYFEMLPRLSVSWRGQTLTEFSLDGAISRHPQLILIDEMAHTNVPGLRHEKRWQDILELLDNHIDVYTTLNVQHIESLNDDISRIIHAPIRETIPDSMIDLADTIELVDLPTEDLLKRLHEGRIYVPERAEIAAKHFFLKGNLIALRELALRVTAERVGKLVQGYRDDFGIRQVWSTHERILVCVGAGTESLQLIRAGKQLAGSLQCEWFAAHVDAARNPDSPAAQNSVTKNLRFAEQLGAETSLLSGMDSVHEILHFARTHNITLIMVWKSILPRWKEFLKRRLADEIARNSGQIDVYIMTGKPGEMRATSPLPERKKQSVWKLYTLFLLMIAFMTGTVFYLSPGFLPAGNAVLILLAVSVLTGYLNLLMRRQTDTAHFAIWYATALYRLGRLLATTRGEENVIALCRNFLSSTLHCQIAFFVGSEPGNAMLSRHDTPETGEEDIIQWVSRMRQMAGMGTDTLPARDALYVPVPATRGTLGVMRARPEQPGQLFSSEQLHLLEAAARQLGLVLEVERLQLPTVRPSTQPVRETGSDD